MVTCLATEYNVLLGHTLHRHSGTGVVSAQLFDEGRGERWVGFELGELSWVPEEFDDALKHGMLVES